VTSRSDRTEKPTQRRLTKAKEEGQVAKSQEVSVAVSLVLLVVAVRVIAPSATGTLVAATNRILSSAGSGAIGPGVGPAAFSMILVTVVPVAAMAMVAALLAGVGQVGFAWSPKAAKPKLSHLSVKKNMQRFAPKKAMWELFRSFAKIALLFALAWGPLSSVMETVALKRAFGPGVAAIFTAAWQILLRTAILMVLIGAADFAFNKRKTMNDLKMTKQEVKQEAKDMNGSPEIKQARRQRAAELSRNRMITAAAAADVIITNPTHLAVALKYETGEPAPRVVAKGADSLAKRIRKEGRRNGVPVFEDKPLARALFRKTKVGHYVPVALFEAVAMVLAMAYRRKARR
jgi:flagellar biosynthetic protein FlhB